MKAAVKAVGVALAGTILAGLSLPLVQAKVESTKKEEQSGSLCGFHNLAHSGFRSPA